MLLRWVREQHINHCWCARKAPTTLSGESVCCLKHCCSPRGDVALRWGSDCPCMGSAVGKGKYWLTVGVECWQGDARAGLQAAPNPPAPSPSPSTLCWAGSSADAVCSQCHRLWCSKVQHNDFCQRTPNFGMFSLLMTQRRFGRW